MILSIDSKDQKKVTVSLKKNGRLLKSLVEQNEFGSQVLLPLINKILKEEGIEFKDLREIEVEVGPGSFTGLKVGVSVANALGFTLGIPVNGKKVETALIYD